MMWDSDHHDHQWLKIVCWIVVQVLEEKDFLFRTSPVDMTVELWMLHVYNWMEPVKYCNISVRNIVEYCGISQESLSHQSSVPATTSGGAKTWHILWRPKFLHHTYPGGHQVARFLRWHFVGAAQLLSQKKRKTDSSFFAKVGNLVTLMVSS